MIRGQRSVFRRIYRSCRGILNCAIYGVAVDETRLRTRIISIFTGGANGYGINNHAVGASRNQRVWFSVSREIENPSSEDGFEMIYFIIGILIPAFFAKSMASG